MVRRNVSGGRMEGWRWELGGYCVVRDREVCWVWGFCGGEEVGDDVGGDVEG